jgi:hypothetical protein
MTGAFLLRYQEPCLPVEVMPTCGTRTETKNHGENGDADPHTTGHMALPRVAVAAGTSTKTSAGAGEVADTDPAHESMRAIPRP